MLILDIIRPQFFVVVVVVVVVFWSEDETRKGDALQCHSQTTVK